MSAGGLGEALGAIAEIEERRRTGEPAPYAGCPADSEPVVASLEVPGHEWLCMVCGRRFTYFSVRLLKLPPTEELEARYAELRARYEAGERP